MTTRNVEVLRLPVRRDIYLCHHYISPVDRLSVLLSFSQYQCITTAASRQGGCIGSTSKLQIGMDADGGCFRLLLPPCNGSGAFEMGNRLLHRDHIH